MCTTPGVGDWLFPGSALPSSAPTHACERDASWPDGCDEWGTPEECCSWGTSACGTAAQRAAHQKRGTEKQNQYPGAQSSPSPGVRHSRVVTKPPMLHATPLCLRS